MNIQNLEIICHTEDGAYAYCDICDKQIKFECKHFESPYRKNYENPFQINHNVQNPNLFDIEKHTMLILLITTKILKYIMVHLILN